MTVRVRRDSGLEQLVAVRRQLQQRRDLGMAGQLGIEHGVAAAGLLDQEIGTAMEPAVEEGRLEHDVRPGAQGSMDSACLAGRVARSMAVAADDVVNASSR